MDQDIFATASQLRFVGLSRRHRFQGQSLHASVLKSTLRGADAACGSLPPLPSPPLPNSVAIDTALAFARRTTRECGASVRHQTDNKDTVQSLCKLTCVRDDLYRAPVKRKWRNANINPMSPPDIGSPAEVIDLCRGASLEMSVHDRAALSECAALLPSGARVYINHLPRQRWEQTIAAARDVRAVGLEPVPHVPACQLADHGELGWLLGELAQHADVAHILLVAGDRPQPKGEFAQSIDVMKTGLLGRHGITRVSLAGYPEGHPKVGEVELRASAAAKAALAAELGLGVTFLTQFAFNSAPIIHWARQMREQQVGGDIRVGLAGPARLATLLKYAMHCGVGASISALSTRKGAFGRLVADCGPETVIRELARARATGEVDVQGIHLFSFGGLLRTARWIQAVTQGRFTMGQFKGFALTEAG